MNKEVITMRPTKQLRQGPCDIVNKYFDIQQGLIGCQIGSYAGQSTQQFLSTGKFRTLYCIDPWENGYDDTDAASFSNDAAEVVFDSRFREDSRIQKVKGYSYDKLTEYPDQFFDFIYIDGCHTRQAVQKDIKLALPKLKPTGVISGHDYAAHQFPGLVQAVNTALGRKPQFVFQDFSWACAKSAIPDDRDKCLFCIISPGYQLQYRALLRSFIKYNKGWDIVLFYTGSIEIPGVTKVIDITQDLKKYPSNYDMRGKIWSYRAQATLRCLETYSSALYCDSDIYFYGQFPRLQQTTFTLHNNYPLSQRWFDIRCQDGFINTGIYFAKNDKATLQWFKLVKDVQQRGKAKHAICGGPNNMIWDQKMYFFLPFIAPDLYNILKHDGCNVAGWNLEERSIYRKNNQLFANEDPLICFHFSCWHILNKIPVIQNNKTLLELIAAYKKEIRKV